MTALIALIALLANGYRGGWEAAGATLDQQGFPSSSNFLPQNLWRGLQGFQITKSKFYLFLLQDSLSHDIDMITWLAGKFYTCFITYNNIRLHI